jgi:hypothetical protein
MILPAAITSAQEESTKPEFTTGADFYSNYIWRGSKLSTGPAFQPTVKFVAGGLTIGVWGSFDANGYSEVDPYISYAFPFGLSLGVTDYYSPDLPLFEIDTAGSHAIELNAGYTFKGLSLSANYIVNESALTDGSDLYFQAGYAFEKFNISIGAGDGWYTSDGEFNVCHIGIGTTKEIKITDSFSIPVTGQVIMNPEREQLFVVVGFSL